MAEELRVDPDQLYRVGSALDDIGERIVSLFRRFENETAAYDGVCGTDKYGKQIEDESRASIASITEAGLSRGNVAQEFGTGLMDAASDFTQT